METRLRCRNCGHDNGPSPLHWRDRRCAQCNRPLVISAEAGEPAVLSESSAKFPAVRTYAQAIAAIGWLLFVRWDIKAGGGLMQGLFAADVVIALGLLILGFIKKKRQIT